MANRGAVRKKLFQTFKECREPNWGNGHRSTRSRRDLRFSSSILDGFTANTPVPSIGTEPDGHITVEWYRSPQRTLSVSISPDGELHYAALLGAERICGTETFRARMPQVLSDLIARIEERDTESSSR